MTLPQWPTSPRGKGAGRKKKASNIKDVPVEHVDVPAVEAPKVFVEPDVKEPEQEVAFVANPGPQTMFLASSEREVLFGGGKGSSKTYGLMIDPLRYAGCPVTRALIMRRTIPDVKDIVFKAKHMYKKAYPGVQWREQDKMFVFPSGARIEFGFAETQSDLARYQGQNYTYIGIDEVADFPFAEELLTYMRANLRTTDPINAPPMLRLTANPGAVSSRYIREQFVDKAPYNTTFWVAATFTDMRTNEKKTMQISRKYIHSTVFNNPHLLKDESYLATLASLPEAKRKAWLDGEWHYSETSAFPEFDKTVHVVPPFEIPSDLKRVKGCDFGYRQPGAVYWGAMTPQGQLVIYREYVFQGKDALRVAQEGKSMELGEQRSLGVLDASVWQVRGTLGESIGEIMQRHWPSWVPSSRTRVNNTSSRANRKNLIHQYLAIDPTTGEPRMVILPYCRKLIEALQAIPVDKQNPECFDTDSEYDHYVDALSYLLQGRPAQFRSWTDSFGARPTEQSYKVYDATFGY